MAAVYYCLEHPIGGSMGQAPKARGSTYGYSRDLASAAVALERGRRRGVTWGEIVERKSPPRGLRANVWLTPFDDRRAGFTP